MAPGASNTTLDGYTPESIVAFYQASWIPQYHYLAIGSAALVLYEHMISAQQEYQVIWRRKFSVPMVLFVVNRYLLVIHSVLFILWYLMWFESDVTCEVIGRATGIVEIPLDVANGVFTAVRVHAINRRNWYCTSVVLMLGICAIPKNIAFVATAHVQTNYPVFRGCRRDEGILKFDQDTWLKLTLSTRILHRIVQNVVVLGITWYRTYGVVIAAWKAKCATSVVSVMLRDGTMYFLITLIPHIAGVVTLGMAGSHNLNMPIYAVDGVVMARFILNLRVATSRDCVGMESTSMLPSHSTSIRFRSGVNGALEDMSAPVCFAGDDECDDEEDEL